MPAQAILHFWFEELTAKQHFAKDAALDETIRTRFGDTLDAAARCELFAWRSMGAGLFELRPKGPEGIGRVFYCTQVGHTIVVLHSFVKKTQETPDAELRLARKRLKDMQHG